MTPLKTKQEILDYVIPRFKAQGKRSLRWSVDTVGGYAQLCAYTGKDGSHCLIGFLFRPEIPTKIYEGTQADSLPLRLLNLDVDALVAEFGSEGALYTWLQGLQNCHDLHWTFKEALDSLESFASE